jgi:hypothetical protein
LVFAEDLGCRVLELAEDLFFLDGRESIEQYRHTVRQHELISNNNLLKKIDVLPEKLASRLSITFTAIFPLDKQKQSTLVRPSLFNAPFISCFKVAQEHLQHT